MGKAFVTQLLSPHRQVALTNTEATLEDFFANRADELKRLLDSPTSIGFIQEQVYEWQGNAEKNYKTESGAFFARIKTALKSIIKDGDLKTIKRVFDFAQENDFLSLEERNRHLTPALTKRLESEIGKEIADDMTSIARDLEKEFGLQINGKSIRGKLSKPEILTSPKTSAAITIHALPAVQETPSSAYRNSS